MVKFLLILLLTVVCTDWASTDFWNNGIKKCEDSEYVCFMSRVYGGDAISCIKK